jgi:hypothetical protein
MAIRPNIKILFPALIDNNFVNAVSPIKTVMGRNAKPIRINVAIVAEALNHNINKNVIIFGHHGVVIPIQNIPNNNNSLILYLKYLDAIFNPIIMEITTKIMLNIDCKISNELNTMILHPFY